MSIAHNNGLKSYILFFLLFIEYGDEKKKEIKAPFTSSTHGETTSGALKNQIFISVLTYPSKWLGTLNKFTKRYHKHADLHERMIKLRLSNHSAVRSIVHLSFPLEIKTQQKNSIDQSRHISSGKREELIQHIFLQMRIKENDE